MPNIDVLRLFPGPHVNEDWASVNAYTTSDIDKIVDPAGNTMKEVTSIPSPFARLHLFEQAFKAVAVNTTTMKGKTIFNKLVSDALDVGEVLFNYDTFQKSMGNLEIVTWNKNIHIRELQDSDEESHQLVGNTLSLYLTQDGSKSNFDKMENIHLILCNHQCIGGTSPATLFFAAYNDEYELEELGLKQGDDTFFDDGFAPLHERSLDFQKYLHGLFKVNKSLQTQMRLFYDYLQKSLECLKTEKGMKAKHDELYKYINASTLEADFPSQFLPIEPGLDIFGGIQHLKKGVSLLDLRDSDFALKPDFPITGRVPLILVNGFSESLKYVEGNWNRSYKVPHAPEEILEKRVLPEQHEMYPYLTTSDFLEPTLIKLRYRINSDYFFDGNPTSFFDGDRIQKTIPDFSYLLPIKPLYFKYFKIDKLRELAYDRQHYFKMTKLGADKIEVVLRIPIKAHNRLITFKRVYETNVEINEAENKGVIRPHVFNIGFLPMTVLKNGDSFYQHLMLVDNDVAPETTTRKYDLKFYGNQGNLVDSHQHAKRNEKNAATGVLVTTQFFILKKAYEAIQITSGSESNGAKGFLLPIFKKVDSGVRQFTFAIDFGTTNTHIEYSVDNEEPVPFEIQSNDRQLVTLSENDCWYYKGAAVSNFYPQFVPELIGKGNQDKFPIATGSAEIDNLNHAQPTFGLGQINVAFFYQKYSIQQYTKLHLNLKWQPISAANRAPENRLKAFLGELLFLIRNKVIMNGGNLNTTQLLWFFPSSMDKHQKNAFSSIWRELFHQYITTAHSPHALLEAEVPFYMYDANQVSSDSYPVVNIDIGGGTTDIVFFKNNMPKAITSVRFAGNNVWGDGYSTTVRQNNGFINAYKPMVQEWISSNGFANLASVMRQIETNNAQFGSAALMAFFFSIDDNKEVVEKHARLNLSHHVANDSNFKIVFLVFYTSIVYYIARLMKLLEMDEPRNICLSGNGSRIIGLLEVGSSDSSEELTTLVFQTVYKNSYHQEGVNFVQHSAPKEATCKGGIKKQQKKITTNYDSLLWLGDKAGTLVNEKSINYPVNRLKYSQITQAHKQGVLDEYTTFLDAIEEWHEEMNLFKNFGIDGSKLKHCINVLKKEAASDLNKGLSNRIAIDTDSVTVAETLFFYPLIGGLYNLIQDIGKGLQTNSK